MTAEFNFVDINGVRYSHDKDPELCPLCHHAVMASQETWSLPRRNTPNLELEIVFRCPRADCGRLFIARYNATTGISKVGSTLGEFVLAEVTPRAPIPPDIPPEVAAISPGFASIYAEAAAAESYGLEQICGVGFRKSLEFLVKDHCIRSHPAREDEVRGALLGLNQAHRVASVRR
jgi:hypothetical protein